MNEFEDIEQLLKPQCEFKASDTLKQKVTRKARQEASSRHIVRMWPWLAAACVAGFIIMFLMPPKKVLEKPVDDPLLAAKAETPLVADEQQAEETAKQENVRIVIPKRPKAKRPPKVVQEEPTHESVEMSEETRMELLLANLNKDVPQMEDIDTEEEIRQIRMRGERLLSMYHSINH